MGVAVIDTRVVTVRMRMRVRAEPLHRNGPRGPQQREVTVPADMRMAVNMPAVLMQRLAGPRHARTLAGGAADVGHRCAHPFGGRCRPAGPETEPVARRAVGDQVLLALVIAATAAVLLAVAIHNAKPAGHTVQTHTVQHQ